MARSAHRIRISYEARKSLKYILLKSITKNQRLILSEINGDGQSVSFFLRRLSTVKNVPLSTLKLGLKNLKELELIKAVPSSALGYSTLELTESGILVLNFISNNEFEGEIYATI